MAHGCSLAKIQVTLVVVAVVVVEEVGVSFSLRLIFLTSTVEVFTGGLGVFLMDLFSHMCLLSLCQLTEDQQQPCHNLGVPTPAS